VRVQVAAVLALAANVVVLLLFVLGTFMPGWFPHVMTHPPEWFWPAAIGLFVALLAAARMGTMTRDARAARRSRARDVPSG
jgi:integral membrane sensor domain MASE1